MIETLLLNVKDVEKIIIESDIISTVEEGYIAYNRGKINQPDIVSIDIPEKNGELDIKSCYNELNNYITIKMASGFYDNGIKFNLPTMLGVITLIDGDTGAPLCIMDGSLITGVRTAAAGAISAKLLSRKNSKTVAVFGAGTQARLQIYALKKIRDIEVVQVYSEKVEELEKYKIDIEKNTNLKVVLCSTPKEALNKADIVITTTPSKNYYIDSSYIEKGMHIIAVGADMAGKNELDPKIFKNAKIINDSIPQCTSRGETRNAIISGMIKESDIHAEIGQLLEGQKALRESEEEITIFDTTGMGVQDNVVAAKIYEVAKLRNIGKEFSFL